MSSFLTLYVYVPVIVPPLYFQLFGTIIVSTPDSVSFILSIDDVLFTSSYLNTTNSLLVGITPTILFAREATPNKLSSFVK